MSFNGKVSYMRIKPVQPEAGAGPITREVSIGLESEPDKTFGFRLRPGEADIGVQLAWLSLFRDAYVHRIGIRLWADMQDIEVGMGIQPGMITMVELHKDLDDRPT